MAISDYSATDADNKTVPGSPAIEIGKGIHSPQGHDIQRQALQRIMADLKSFHTTYSSHNHDSAYAALVHTHDLADITDAGTAAAEDIGTSGDAVPKLNAANTWSAAQTIETTGNFDTQVTLKTTSAGTGFPQINFIHDSASPAQFDGLGRFNFQGRNDAATLQNGAFFQCVAGAVGAGSEDYYLQFYTRTGASEDLVAMFRRGVVVGSPTGSDKGAGTLNAVGVYDDNVLLSCYPFDAYLDGAIDEAKWDAKVPDRVHEKIEYRETREKGKTVLRGHKVETVEPRQHGDMRRFKARLGTEYDPLDIDKYTAHWREKRHLTSLPNEKTFDPVKGMPTGAWIQRLVETVEIQAIHIAQIHERLKKLEAA
jgi:hypothetical protein